MCRGHALPCEHTQSCGCETCLCIHLEWLCIHVSRNVYGSPFTMQPDCKLILLLFLTWYILTCNITTPDLKRPPTLPYAMLMLMALLGSFVYSDTYTIVLATQHSSKKWKREKKYLGCKSKVRGYRSS